MKKILIKGGEIVTSESIFFADLLLVDGKIQRILDEEEQIDSDEVIDATGKLVLPGLIDVHVHLREPGETYKEDFGSGSKAAVHGGVTTVLDMPNNKPPILTCDDLDNKRALAEGKFYANYGFYMGFNGENLAEIRRAHNIPGVKLYTTHSTGNMGVSDEMIEQLFEKAGRRIVVHAEDHELIEGNMERVRGELGESVLPEMHSKIREPLAAEKAVRRACELAEKHGAKLHVAHISTEGEIEIINQFRKAGVTCEVAPHHLFFCEDDYEKLGNLLKVNPPIRSRQDLFALWKALKFGEIDIIATDHAPHTLEEKAADFWSVPSGMPELDTLLPLMLNVVNDEGLTISEVVKLCCEKPAEIFGLEGKGFIREGFDADLVIVDMDKENTLSNSDLYTKCLWTPYDGNLVKGAIVSVLVNGQIAFVDGRIQGKPYGKEVVIS